MKNITLSDEDQIIDDLRRVAQGDKTTVNTLFRGWAREYLQTRAAADRRKRLKAFDELMSKGPVFTSKRKYTRDEMNER